MEIEFKNQFCDEFGDIPDGEIFMDELNKLYIKIYSIIKDGCNINAIYLKNGCSYSFENNEKVKWLENAKLVMNE